MKPEPKSCAEVFQHPKNILIGNGRVLWGTATTDISGTFHPAGWVLPGGRRTEVRALAELVARNIDNLSN